MHPVMMARTSQILRDPDTSATRRSSMTESRSGEATYATRRHTTNSMQLGNTVDKLKLLDSSVYSTEKNLARSEKSNVAISAPLIAVQRELVGQRTSSANALSKHGHPASTDDIHHKVVQVVTETDALKPTTPTRRATDSTASAQVGQQSRGLAKLLGRIYSKSASPESEAFKKRSKLGSGEKDSLLTRSAGQPDKKRPAVSSTEIRLNEDQNLNRNKIQQMMGVQSICHHASSTLIRGHSYGHQSGTEVTPEEEQHRLAELTREHGHESRCTSWSSANPFDTEEDFECDLDQGILHASPAGSSTPRIRVQQCLDTSPSNYSIRDLSGDSLGQVNVAKVVQIGKRDRINEPTIHEVAFQTAGLDPRQSLRGGCLRPKEEIGHAKKHPSPSKRDLEELERAFRQYELPPAPYQDDDDADELAAASPTALFAGERS
ncbi:hypothetical protein E4U54_000552 [Claviceps lovelessii]|nr:hypothetical protein E4U54_000552 [Claviceps lovelessii]